MFFYQPYQPFPSPRPFYDEEYALLRRLHELQDRNQHLYSFRPQSFYGGLGDYLHYATSSDPLAALRLQVEEEARQESLRRRHAREVAFRAAITELTRQLYPALSPAYPPVVPIQVPGPRAHPILHTYVKVRYSSRTLSQKHH
jgi:hypothetical protein